MYKVTKILLHIQKAHVYAKVKIYEVTDQLKILRNIQAHTHTCTCTTIIIIVY